MRTIAHISDLHFGRHHAAVCDALLGSLKAHAPDLVVVSGDLTQRARTREFAAARRFLDRIDAPKLIVPGNHDIPLYDVFERMFAPLDKYDRAVATAGVPSCLFVDDEIAVMGLNTVRRLTGKNGRVSLAQMTRVRQAFTALPSRMKVLVTHHPIGVAQTAAPLQLAGRSVLALQAVSAAGVHLLLSGHHHRTAYGEIDADLVCKSSVLVVHAGTAISRRTRRGETNAYNLVRINGENIQVTVLSWMPPEFRQTGQASYVLACGRWRPSQPGDTGGSRD